jgi:hypothetical protein
LSLDLQTDSLHFHALHSSKLPRLSLLELTAFMRFIRATLTEPPLNNTQS